MHTDLQVLVWQYSHEVEYKFLGEVSTLLGFSKYITVVTLIFVMLIFVKWCLDQHFIFENGPFLLAVHQSLSICSNFVHMPFCS